MVPGRPLFFATAVPFGGVAAPVLVESHEGHPTKVEGNPEHPASLGADRHLHAGRDPDLYDPDRSQTVSYRGEVRGWGDFLSAVKTALAAQKAQQGAGLRFLTETITSPTVGRADRADPAGASRRRSGTVGSGRARRRPRPPPAQTDADLPLRQGRRRRLARRRFPDVRPGGRALRARLRRPPRRVDRATRRTMNRLYAVESTPTLTGAKADHRLALRASEIEAFARALARRGRRPTGRRVVVANATADKWVDRRREGSAGASRTFAGRRRATISRRRVHALAHADEPGAGQRRRDGRPTSPTVEVNPTDQLASLRDLVAGHGRRPGRRCS